MIASLSTLSFLASLVSDGECQTAGSVSDDWAHYRRHYHMPCSCKRFAPPPPPPCKRCQLRKRACRCHRFFLDLFDVSIWTPSIRMSAFGTFLAPPAVIVAAHVEFPWIPSQVHQFVFFGCKCGTMPAYPSLTVFCTLSKILTFSSVLVPYANILTPSIKPNAIVA